MYHKVATKLIIGKRIFQLHAAVKQVDSKFGGLPDGQTYLFSTSHIHS